MCGIAGYLKLDGGRADAGVLTAMCDAIVHRGPDSAGYLVEDGVALGMRRLAIIDLSTGDQPMHGRGGAVSLVYNGESYDFLEQRARLEAEGVPFATHSDTEVVLKLYERDGLDFVEGLRGMFGLAIWDRDARRLVLARDRIGKKPVHWYRDDEVFVFGSEIKSILRALAMLGRPRPAIERRALVPYLGLGYVPDPLTAFVGIHKLPPGSLLILGEDGRPEIRRYWTHRPEPDPTLDEDEHLARIDAALEEAVRLRLIADVPLGAFLSGGVDSSTVVGMAARVSSSPVRTFSIGFDEKDYSELEHARKVARHVGADHAEMIVRPDAETLVDELVRQFDEPFADSSAIPSYYVSKIARQHVTVVLSGDGGDELFAGYARHHDPMLAGPLAGLPPALKRAVFGGTARLLPPGFFGRSKLVTMGLDDDERYAYVATAGLHGMARSVFTPGFREAVGTAEPGDGYLARMREVADLDPVARRAHADFLIYLPADIMTKVDRTSMMVSLEARAPMLDHRFVEVCGRVPLAIKTRTGPKHLLKRLARTLVPPEVIDRPKQGFAIPISEWINAGWRARADDLLRGIADPRRDIVQPGFVTRILDEHRRGRRDHGQMLWTLMMLESFLRAYEDDRAFSA